MSEKNSLYEPDKDFLTGNLLVKGSEYLSDASAAGPGLGNYVHKQRHVTCDFTVGGPGQLPTVVGELRITGDNHSLAARLEADLAFTSSDRDRWSALAAKLATEKDELAGSSREIIAEQMDRITTIKGQLKSWKARALLAEFELNRRNASLHTALGRHPR